MATVPYERRAHYHETDQMGVIYHANYIRWFEEARVDFMNQLGLSYKALEEAGVISPVISMHLDYKASVKFDDLVLIYVDLTLFDGVRMSVRYRVADKATGQLKCAGESKHCFINNNGRPMSIKKACPEYYDLYSAAVEINKEYFI